METSHLQDLKPIRSLTWEETFAFWRESEGSSPEWLAVAKERGYDTWEEWRLAYAPHFRLTERAWTLYRVMDPLRTVPEHFHGAPFQGWIERTYGDAGPMPTFAVIAANLFAKGNGRASAIKGTFPRRTTVLGVLAEKGVVIFEGMHRCSAIAKLAADGATLETDFSIALGSYLPGTIEVLEKVYKRSRG
ncbi:MAG: hypothetical protein QY323_05180 [Patescibacteria group bacterium]|nr:MAG: hypothetical protein QY323_05180 [Patescibacteria group bacterium]